MQRHRHDDGAGRNLNARRKDVGDGLGEADLATIFQAQRDIAGNLAIGDGGCHMVETRRLRQARRADHLIAKRQRHAAMRATLTRDEVQPRPARCAECVRAADDHSAGGAARRQDEIERVAGQAANTADESRGHIARKASALFDAAPRHAPLSRERGMGTSGAMTVPEIFDRHARALRRDAQRGEDLFGEALRDELIDRLSMVRRDFARALVIGADAALVAAVRARVGDVLVTDVAPGRAAAMDGLVAQEDALHFPPGSFDLVLSSGCLDSIADLPGALALIRRAMMPDGLLLASFVGGPSLPSLRRTIAIADGERAVARLHPQIDVRAAGDLLMRAGFALPVADTMPMTLAYRSLDRLIADLRAGAMTNVLMERHRVDRAWLDRASQAFAAMAEPDGRTRETMTLITLTAWSPGPDQPQPAKRGSATQSLAAALKSGGAAAPERR